MASKDLQGSCIWVDHIYIYTYTHTPEVQEDESPYRNSRISWKLSKWEDITELELYYNIQYNPRRRRQWGCFSNCHGLHLICYFLPLDSCVNKLYSFAPRVEPSCCDENCCHVDEPWVWSSRYVIWRSLGSEVDQSTFFFAVQLLSWHLK